MNKTLSFDVSNAEIVEDLDTSQFATARIDAFSTGKTRHDTTCDLVALQRTAPTIYEKPLIFEYNSNFGDFGSHNAKTTVPAGFVVPNSAEFVEMRDGSGRISLRVFAKIWKKYSGKFLRVFSDTNTKNKSVSVEMEVLDAEETTDGLLNLLDWRYAAICALGDFVTEASPGAEMELLSFAKEETEEYQNAYLAEFASRYDELDFKIPDGVKNAALEGLSLYVKHKKGGTSVALSIGRFLSKNETIIPEKVKSLATYFMRHSGDNFDDKEGKDWIGWQLRGGKDALNWSKKLVESMDKIDQRKIAYFQVEGLVTFPYKNIEDANPSLKNWKPPLSLSQINSIAKQADAISGEYGWPTAIKHFKETHEPNKDGTAWVEKSKEEKMADEKEEKKPEVEMAEKPADSPVEEKKEEEKEPVAEEKKEEMAAEVPAEKKEEEKKSVFAEFANLIAYMEEEVGEDEPAKMCKMAAEELKKSEGADFAVVAGGMYAKMCKMATKSAEMSVEMSALKEFKAGIEAQQKQFAVDQTFRELDEKVVIPDDSRKAMVEDAEKYSFAEINIWQNNCKATAFNFALKIKESDEGKIKRYAMPFANLPKPANNGSVWPAKNQ